MTRIAMVAAVAVLAACSKGKEANTNDTSTVGGAVGPAVSDTSSSTGAMSGGAGMSTGTMSGGAGMSSGSTTSSDTSSKMSSGMRGDTAGSSRSAGTKSGEPKNQTQSGMTTSKGHSTLGPNVTKTSPTAGQAVTSKGDTLNKSKVPR